MRSVARPRDKCAFVVPTRYISLTAWHVFSATDVLLAVAAFSGAAFALASLFGPLGRGTMLLPEAIALGALGATVHRIIHAPPIRLNGHYLILFGPDLHLAATAAPFVAAGAALALLASEVWLQRAAGGQQEHDPGGEA